MWYKEMLLLISRLFYTIFGMAGHFFLRYRFAGRADEQGQRRRRQRGGCLFVRNYKF